MIDILLKIVSLLLYIVVIIPVSIILKIFRIDLLKIGVKL